jgi:hypothetical protein
VRAVAVNADACAYPSCLSPHARPPAPLLLLYTLTPCSLRKRPHRYLGSWLCSARPCERRRRSHCYQGSCWCSAAGIKMLPSALHPPPLYPTLPSSISLCSSLPCLSLSLVSDPTSLLPPPATVSTTDHPQRQPSLQPTISPGLLAAA